MNILVWLPTFLGLGVALALRPTARAILSFVFEQYAIWKCWLKLPHTSAPFTLLGDAVEHRSRKSYRAHLKWSKQLGGVFGLRLAHIPVRLESGEAAQQKHPAAFANICKTLKTGLRLQLVMITDPHLAKPFFNEPKSPLYGGLCFLESGE